MKNILIFIVSFLVGALVFGGIAAAFAWVGGWQFDRGLWAVFVTFATLWGGIASAAQVDYTR